MYNYLVPPGRVATILVQVRVRHLYLLKTVPFLLFVAIGLTAARIFLMLQADLFPDEALYAWLGHSAPFNFCPHPPGTPLLTRAGLELFGHSEMGAQFGSLLLSTLILLPIYFLAKQLGGLACARWSVLAYACTPFFVAFGAITTPDGPQLFCFAVALYCTWQALQHNANLWWVAAGATVALGLYFKYIIILYLPSLLLALLLVPAWRRYLLTPGPYLAAVAVLVLFLGVAAWRDSLTGWSALSYHLKDRQVSSGFSLKNAAVYHGIHLGYYSPLLYLIALWAMGKSLLTGVRQVDPRLLFLGAFGVVPWLFFAVIAAFTERDLSREQWDACAYIPAYIAAGIFVTAGARRKFPLHYLAPAIGAFTLAVLMLEIRNAAVTRAIDRDPLFTKISGWRFLGYVANGYIAESFPKEEKPFILTDSFAPALEVSFYTRNKYPVYSLPADRNIRYGLNEVLDATGVSLAHLEREVGRNGLVLLEDKSRRGTVTSETETVSRMFESVEELRRIAAFRQNRQIRVFRAFKGSKLKDVRRDEWASYLNPETEP